MRVDSTFVMAKSVKRPQSAPQQDSQSPIAPASSAAAPQSGRDRVALRAYELYTQRGGSDGRDMDDWLTAERELGSNRDADPDGE